MDILGRSTPERVGEKTRSMMEICGAGGRYAIGSGNSIPNYVPVENYLAHGGRSARRRRGDLKASRTAGTSADLVGGTSAQAERGTRSPGWAPWKPPFIIPVSVWGIVAIVRTRDSG